MLELRPFCECCATALTPDSSEALICSFECTFCSDCNNRHLQGICPNCGGNLVPRPIRPEAHLSQHPPSSKRIVKAAGCSDLAKVGA